MCLADWKKASDKTIVCYCMKVNKQGIVSAIQAGADSIKQIRQITGACTGNQCKELNPEGRCCHLDIVELLKFYGNN
ncbi:MAG: (2Fe-2S)-binding protein [Sedimentisphaerales bacterium]|nr:(2Fe-2S)-binding protein [Sedimentisphaerales bacterium]